MATIEITFTFVATEGAENRYTFTDDFIVCGGLISDIDEYAEEWIEDKQEDSDVEWGLDSWEVAEFEEDFGEYSDPAMFKDLDEYGTYVEQCEEHGEGYVLRFADVGDEDFNDHYQGCWESKEQFVRELVESCETIPSHLDGYIDYEKMARNYMMDYSSYESADGLHIFRN